MSDDPLKYLAAQIQEGKKAVQQTSTKQERKSDPSQDAETAASVTHQFLDVQDDSATPSEASYRHTISATACSTPLTSAGITPGETARRVSETARKSVTGVKKPGSNLRNDSNSQPASTGVRSLEAHKHSAEAEAIKKTLRLVTDVPTRPQSDNIVSTAQPRPIMFSVPDLNKSLPPPPLSEEPNPEEQKQPHISRLMKTIRNKKSMVTEGRSFSTSSTPPMPSMQSQNAPRTPHSRTSTDPTAAQEPPRKRFRIPLFHRRRRPAEVVVA